MWSNRSQRAPLKSATLVLGVLLPWFAAKAVQAQSDHQDDPRVVREGETLTAAQAANEPIAYVFNANEGSSYLVQVDQRGLDFIVSVQTPDGSTTRYNSPLERDEREFVLLENTMAGQYLFTLASQELTGATGAHTIQVSRLVGDERPEYLQALRLMCGAAAEHAEGNSSLNQGARTEYARDDGGGPERLMETGLTAYMQAYKLLEEIGRDRDAAQALYSEAMLAYWTFYEWDLSAEWARAASERYVSLSEPTLAANAKLLQARALIEALKELGPGDAPETRLAEVERLLDEVSAAHATAGNIYDLARSLFFRGLAYTNVNQLDKAKIFYQGNAEAGIEGAAQLYAEADEWRKQLDVRLGLGVIQVNTGEPLEAIHTLERLLDDIPPEPWTNETRNFVATVHDQLGAAHREYGNIDQALRTLSLAREGHAEAGDPHGEVSSIRGIARTYLLTGEFELARDYLEQAERKARETNEGLILSLVQSDLGDLAFRAGDYGEALEQHEAVATASSGSARAYREAIVARDLIALGRYSEAVRRVTGALSIAGISTRDYADLLSERGRAYLAIGDTREAEEDLLHALTEYEGLSLREEQAIVLNDLARVAQRSERYDDALRYGARALESIESLRAEVSAPELRALFSGARHRYYETQIDLLMTAGNKPVSGTEDNFRQALEVSERGRSRMTLELLAEVAVSPSEDSVREERDRRIEELAAMRSEESPESLATIENELNLLAVETGGLPEHVSSLNAAEMQHLVGSESVLLQYALGNERSYVWVVTEDAVRGFQLSDRETIETAARRAHESLKQPSVSSRSWDPALLDLAREVIAPIANDIDSKRLLIVADGALNYIPFGVLPLEVEGRVEPLLESREVVNVPSLSVLAVLRARQSDAAPKMLAVIADPVFEAGEEPVYSSSRGTGTKEPGLTNLLTRSSVKQELQRLPAAGVEAEAIANLVLPNELFFAVRGEATRERVLAEDLGQYRFVHFATHGLVDSRYPALSSLALSQFDEAGAPIDGYLRLHDIYGLNLHADLVVLSACETALGREIAGEGFVGLTQGFFYAGAQSLVVSMWQVSDRATAELMRVFYDKMIVQGLRPVEALRAAQLTIRENPRWRNPYFWGAFILLGDWR